jgi:hypothetical protein
MMQGAPSWLRIVMAATALVFVGVVIYVFGFSFTAHLHPDDTTIVLLADKALHAKSPVATDWYYANREIWAIGPHLLALLPVAIAGVSKAALWISLVIGFAFQLVVLAASYQRLARERWLAVFATIVTSIAWSHDHIDLEYVQLAYGFGTCLYLLAFTSFASVGADGARSRDLVLGASLVAILATSSPTRTLVFLVVPLLVASAWPWRQVSRRARAMIACGALAGWVVAFALYKLVLVRVVTFSYPGGYATLTLADVDRIVINLRSLPAGMIALCGGDGSFLRAVPGLAVLAGALVLVAHELFASRAFTARRFTSAVVLVQLGVVLVALVFGTLASNSVRYLIPSLLLLVGLAVLIAVDAIRGVQSWLRRLAVAWLIAVPLAALAAVPDARPQPPDPQTRPDASAIAPVADALEQRGLHRGFAANLVANLLTVESSGDVMACPILLWHAIIPQRWLTSTSCFDRAMLPARFFVVAGRSEIEREAIHNTLGEPLERFAAGPTYDVYIFAAADIDPAWLDLPIRDGRDAVFPLRIEANNLQLLHDKAALDHDQLVSTGDDGIMVYGPYMSLPRGRYRVTWRGRALADTGKVGFAVNADGGKESLNWTELEGASLPHELGTLATRDILLKTQRDQIELVVQIWNGARIALTEIVIENR